MWKITILLTAALLALGGVVAYRSYANQPIYLLEKGRAALDRSNWVRAERCAVQLAQNGQMSATHLLRGEALLRSARGEDPAKARSALTSALKELTQVRGEQAIADQATVLAAECLIRQGERRLAADALETLLKRHPDNLDAHRWAAAIYIDLNSTDNAIRHLEAWSELDPATGRPLRWIGKFYKDYSQEVRAISVYQEALKRDLEPSMRADVIQELAETCMWDRADYTTALDAVEHCPAPYDAKPMFLYLRAEALWGLEKRDQAIRYVEQALKLDPELLPALLLRAKIHLTDDQPKQALALLEKAVASSPHDIRTRQYLMNAYRMTGQTAAAERERKALEETRIHKKSLTLLHRQAVQQPWSDEVRVHIAELCLKIERPAEARMWADAALACNPENRQAQELLRQLPAATNQEPAFSINQTP
jgi:tetratricopeptide (TPR) repeat protein